MLRSFFTSVALMSLLLLCIPAAFAERAYQIDLMVFANNDPSEAQSESWPTRLHLRYPPNWLNLDNGSLIPAPAPAEEFRKIAESMRLSSRYRILLARSWIQSLQSRNQAPALVVKGGRQVGEHFELEGYIRVAVERYLYVESNLWFSRFGPGNGDYYLPNPPRRNAPVEDTFVDESFENSPEYQAFLAQNPQLREDNSSADTFTTTRAQNIDRIVVMDQSRRMRSDELHFIDHPLFGALVYISKPDPEALNTAPSADAKAPADSVPTDTMGQQ